VILSRPDPSQLVLQVAATNLDGTPKTALSSADVRVYHVDGAGAEVEDLASTALTQVGTSSVWRYRWEPSSLDVDQYSVEYTLVDTDSAVFIGLEDLAVEDFALQTNVLLTEADVALIKKIETGRWKIDDVTDQMIFYDPIDGTTPILTFDLKDLAGLPSSVNIFERDPV